MSHRHARISLALIGALLIGVIAYSLSLSVATATAGNPGYTPAIQLPLPAHGTTNQFPNYPTYRSPNFRVPGQQTETVTLTVHVPASLFSFDFELVVQNRATGAVSAQPLRGVVNKSDPSLVHATLQLPHGAYVIGLYESSLTAGINPWGCSGTLTVQGPAALSLRPAPILHAGTSSVLEGAVTNMTGAQPAVVLAIPVAATADYAESAVAATATGRFDVRVPGSGLFDLLAFQPGQGAVALTAVSTMADKKANANLTLPHWSTQDYTVLVQKGLAYTGNPLWTWGRATGRQPLSLSIAPLQGAPPFRKIRLTVHQHAFSYTGTPWPKNYENLSAIYSVSGASGLLLSAALPGVPTGTNGNDAWPLNRWPYYMAWNLNGAANHATTAGSAPARSPFSVPVLAALRSLAPHTRLPLGGPTLLPPTQWLKGYPSSVTQTTSHGWTVQVYQTIKPYRPNSPQILATTKGIPMHLSDWELGPSWSYGVSQVIAHGLPPLHSLAMDNLLSGAPQDASSEPWRQWPRRPIDLGHGIVGFEYQWKNYAPAYVWQEGDWTLVIPDGWMGEALQTARAMVSYMNVRLLPPAPGVVTIIGGVHGFYATAAWMQDGYRLFVSKAGADPLHEGVGVLRMAVRWRAWR